jgi:DNA/RNA endonuclease G (NUC1)
VAVPTHFYKVIVCETNDGKLDMEAFVMPNTPIDDNAPLTNFQVLLSLEKIIFRNHIMKKIFKFSKKYFIT